jgi:hypothetical protein
MALTDLPVADLADLYGDQIGKNLYFAWRSFMALTDLPVADLGDLYGDQIGKNASFPSDHSWRVSLTDLPVAISMAIRSVRICFFCQAIIHGKFLSVCLSIIHAV